MVRQAFEKELQALHAEIIRMGSLVEAAISGAVTALENMDLPLARSIMAGDDAIDGMERQIERHCLEIILRQQPVARDLRDVTSALKLITDLERIADHAVDISEKILLIAASGKVMIPHHLVTMASISRGMIRGALDAYIGRDEALAAEVVRNDDQVDDLYLRIKDDLIHLIKVDRDHVESLTELLLVAKYFERIADHATNVAEWVVFTIRGDHPDLETVT